jgi:hypothetical protein
MGAQVDEIDIARTAKLMAEQYGVGAESQAKLQADKAFLEGNIELEETWNRVIAAIRQARVGDA